MPIERTVIPRGSIRTNSEDQGLPTPKNVSQAVSIKTGGFRRRVEANPSSVQFAWSVNSTAGAAELPAGAWTTDRLRSVASYAPPPPPPPPDDDEAAAAHLLCWAANDIGAQREPCVFTLVPAAGRPDPLSNCSIVNQTVDGLEVQCEPGHDGGLPQSFVLEVYDALDRSLVRNLTAGRAPRFRLDGFDDGLELELAVYAANAKGAGRQSTLHAYTLRSAARRSVISPVMMHVTPVVGVLIGAVATFLLALLAVLIALRLRRPARPAKPAPAGRKGAASDATGSVDSLDREPDVIPQKNDFVDSDEAAFHQSKLSFYFSPECGVKAPLAKPSSEAELAEAPVARRVTFQCQAATLPRRLGGVGAAAGSRPPPAALDDSAVVPLGALVRLRPETSTGPL